MGESVIDVRCYELVARNRDPKSKLLVFGFPNLELPVQTRVI